MEGKKEKKQKKPRTLKAEGAGLAGEAEAVPGVPGGDALEGGGVAPGAEAPAAAAGAPGDAPPADAGRAEHAAAAPARKGRKGPIPVRTMPMILRGQVWYRCKVVATTEEAVFVEWSGFEQIWPNEW